MTEKNPWLEGWKAEHTDLPYAELGPEGWAVECPEGALLVADCPADQREAVCRLAAAAPRAVALLAEIEKHCQDAKKRPEADLAAEGRELRSRLKQFLVEIGRMP